jgi:hypothetical protein
MRSQWKVIAASAAGTSHAAAGNACQDAFSHTIAAGGALVAAVADGAGSARLAGEGAELAARSAVGYLSRALQADRPGTDDACRSLLRNCLLHTRRRLEERASAAVPSLFPPPELVRGDPDGFAGLLGPAPASAAISLDDFSTTLLAVFVTGEHLAAFQVGDGAIVYQEGTGGLIVACEPDHGEFLNETHFITSADWERHARYRVAGGSGVSSLAMLSDGLEMLAVVHRDNTAHGKFFDPLFDYVRQSDACSEDLRQFLLSDRVCERSDDDKTLVLAARMLERQGSA